MKGNQVLTAKFQTYGCGPTIACGSILTELITGRSVNECLELTADTLIDALDGIPAEKLHSPALAIAALRNALKQYCPTALV